MMDNHHYKQKGFNAGDGSFYRSDIPDFTANISGIISME